MVAGIALGATITEAMAKAQKSLRGGLTPVDLRAIIEEARRVIRKSYQK